MNPSISTDFPAGPEPLPDYKIAAAELAQLWEKTGLKATISGITAKVERENNRPNGWAHVACTVNFFDKNGKERGSIEWKMGTGCIDWKKTEKPAPGSSLFPLWDAMKARQTLNADDQAKIAGYYLHHFADKARAGAAEVLGFAAREGRDACSQSFESWANEYGYDTDSRRAEEIYRACQRSGDIAARILRGTGATPDQFADLASRL